VFALLFQTLVSAFGCPAAFQPSLSQRFVEANAVGVSVDGGASFICTKQGMRPVAVPMTGDAHRHGPFDTPHSDCPTCLSDVCCPNALAPPGETVVPAPATAGAAISLETQRSPSSTDVFWRRNRGPPSSLIA
jgi:hypothetical protein